MASDRFQSSIQAIDDFNRQDPRQFELAYAERLTQWVLRLEPQASEALRLAARGQHIGRWRIQRQKYPEGRGGYLRWREDLKKFHAQKAGEILEAAGYEKDFVDRVRSLVLKKNLKQDREAQILEDALCLVFLETQFEDLKNRTPDGKMKEIVRKTWEKMGPLGRQAALGLTLPAPLRKFLEDSLGLGP